jgi:hypothetical protein
MCGTYVYANKMVTVLEQSTEAWNGNNFKGIMVPARTAGYMTFLVKDDTSKQLQSAWDYQHIPMKYDHNKP